MKLADLSIHAWIQENEIKNEKGEPIDFNRHLYLYDIIRDDSRLLTVMKGAQVGMSTCEILKNHFDAKRDKLDIIYTLPTDQDVSVFVGGKVNRIISNNPCMMQDVADKDSIEQKKVGNSMIYFRGTFTKKAAIMVTADRLSHDEKDSSKLDVIADYQTRLQHSKHKQIHTFSHPSVPEEGVHADWLKSDQKHWFIDCPHCGYSQYLSWDTENPRKMSIDIETEQFVCKKCRGVLTDEDRRVGRWIARHPGREMSGYWVPILMSLAITAKEIVAKWNDPEITDEHFYTKLLGLPYADATSKLLKPKFLQNLTGKPYAPTKEERVVIGIDTGNKLDYVCGTSGGLFFHGEADDYGPLDELMKRWPRAIGIIDAGGDLIGAQKFAARWPGRVFKCFLGGDRKTNELVKWGSGDEHGAVTADRNRIIQLIVGEFGDKRIPVHGTENDWYEYYLDWANLSKMKVLDPDTGASKGYKWVRKGRDHRALATVFWRVGMMRFGGVGKIITPSEGPKQNSYMVEPNNTARFDPKELFDFIEDEQEEDWRA